MKITQTQTVKTDEKPDAVRIEVGGITVLVNTHTGGVTVDGANHVHTKEGEHNTLVVEACRNNPVDLIASLGRVALDAFANDTPARKDPSKVTVRDLLNMDPDVISRPNTMVAGLLSDLLDAGYPASKMRRY